jgi:hypothetical protein
MALDDYRTIHDFGKLYGAHMAARRGKRSNHKVGRCAWWRAGRTSP